MCVCDNVATQVHQSLQQTGVDTALCRPCGKTDSGHTMLKCLWYKKCLKCSQWGPYLFIPHHHCIRFNEEKEKWTLWTVITMKSGTKAVTKTKLGQLCA